ncbi:hypothetical protein V6N11_019086 [Hibiscus sabdariffa]|uniref:NADH-ubiquinone oxidoreductase chain 4 n=1 Tax=Hibiscus sabdariffa TaxID=183260 RepID=A0ABR2R1A6_9ROSI
MSSPGTSSFIGEFLILVGAFQRNSLVATLAALGMILGAAYSLWLYNRVVSGNLKPDFLHKFSDSNGREVSIFIPFLVGGATVRWSYIHIANMTSRGGLVKFNYSTENNNGGYSDYCLSLQLNWRKRGKQQQDKKAGTAQEAVRGEHTPCTRQRKTSRFELLRSSKERARRKASDLAV